MTVMNNGDAGRPGQGAAASLAIRKTPVSLLQELCVRRKMTPDYVLVQVEGAVHEPIFQFTVTVGEIKASGSGASKRKAKHNAAKAVLDLMLQNEPLAPEIQAAFESGNVNGAAGASAPPQDGNPIGKLQEFCMNHRWAPPIYEVEAEEGLPHEKMYRMKVSVKTMSETAVGKSKKIAKRLAATSMHEKLTALLPEQLKQLSVLDDDEEELAGGMRNLGLGAGHDHVGPKVSQWHATMRRATGPRLNALKDAQDVMTFLEPEETLRQIGEEQKFTLLVMPVDEPTANGSRQCLVQMTTTPTSVCFGVGKKDDDAKRSAFYNCLQYIKTVASSPR